MRIRITSTTDASAPKVVALGNGIIWYAYLRSPNILCVQREENGTRDPEVQVAQPVMNFDVIRDPADVNKGWIYWVHDGVLVRSEVAPLTTALNSVAYTRSDSWFNSVRSAGGTGVGLAWKTVENANITRVLTEHPLSSGGTGLTHSWGANEGPSPPVLEWERTPSDLGILVTLPDRTAYRNRNITLVKIYRQETTSAGFRFYASLTVPPSPRPWEPPLPSLRAVVAPTAVPVTRWFATCVRTGKQASEGPPSNTLLDDGNIPTSYVERPLSAGGTGQVLAWSTRDFPPVKKRTVDSVGDGRGFGGTGALVSWTLNGTSIITP